MEDKEEKEMLVSTETKERKVTKEIKEKWGNKDQKVIGESME